MRQILRTFLVLVGLLIITFTARYILLGSVEIVSLKQGSIDQAISASLKTSDTGSYVPIEGKDYTLQDVHYFYGKEWAVAAILPVNNDADPATVVLKLQNGAYKTALGPGNSFFSYSVQVLPSKVAAYLQANGLVSEERLE
jgi:hypothetical protein